MAEKVININQFGGMNLYTKIGLGVAAIVLLLIVNPCVIVSPGHKGVVLNLGAVSEKVLDEGVHFRMPLVQSVIEIDTRVLKEETKAEAASKDLQNISTV
ncbi:MAG TPA: SPFH domain-containing protein, partial [Leptospiraceae bacterium]|nr:SPFH domain-containing protein [Leptospiraceae bacterium]